MVLKQSPPDPDILICLPTYNERPNVAGLVGRIRALPLAAEILFIDDNSPDGTGPVLDDLAGRDRNLQVVHRPVRRGIGSAHLAAIRFAYEGGYRVLITMDADGTHAPEDMPRLLEKSDEAGVVIGSRFLPASADDRLRRQALQSRLAHGLTAWLFKLPCDMSNAFRLYRLDKIDPRIFAQCRSGGYAFFPESLYWLCQNGIMIREVPVSLSRRRAGTSKMRPRDVAAWVARLVVLRWRGRPSSG
ncbi:MAG: glycosyltransferase [Desulfosudaceae bacterium]